MTYFAVEMGIFITKMQESWMGCSCRVQLEWNDMSPSLSLSLVVDGLLLNAECMCNRRKKNQNGLAF